MDTTNSAFLTAIIVTLGKWSKGQGLSPKYAISAVFLAILLSVLSQVNDKLARQFALLILIGAVLVYAKPIVDKTGIAK